jgi:hypothetical protein
MVRARKLDPRYGSFAFRISQEARVDTPEPHA